MMSHFYAVIHGNRGEATRCGSKGSGITTTAAAWSGAVRVILDHDEKTGTDMAHVALVTWHGSGVHRHLYYGPVDEPAPAKGVA